MTHLKILYFTCRPGLTKKTNCYKQNFLPSSFKSMKSCEKWSWKVMEIVLEGHGNCFLKVMESMEFYGEERVGTLSCHADKLLPHERQAPIMQISSFQET